LSSNLPLGILVVDYRFLRVRNRGVRFAQRSREVVRTPYYRQSPLEAIRDAGARMAARALEDGTIFYGVTRAIRPQHVIETGVAAGVSSAFLSAALPAQTDHTVMQDGSSYAWNASGVGWAVPPQIRGAIAPRQSLILEDVKTALPRLLDSLPSVDLFFHNDLHAPDHMLWEYELVRPRLRPGGILLSDDADYGWLRFCKRFLLGSDRFQNIQRLAGARKP
jgi:hypothetical protein